MKKAGAVRRGRRGAPSVRLVAIDGGRGKRIAPRWPPPAPPIPFVAVVLGLETLFVTALLAAAAALRAASPRWPPAALPPLPLAATWVHTASLLCSAVTMRYATWSLRHGHRTDALLALGSTVLLGIAFAGGQAAEIVRLFAAGMAPGQDGYTAAFLVAAISTAGHVLVGLGWVAVAATRIALRPAAGARDALPAACAQFWYFGCLVWMPAFVLLYLW